MEVTEVSRVTFSISWVVCRVTRDINNIQCEEQTLKAVITKLTLDGVICLLSKSRRKEFKDFLA